MKCQGKFKFKGLEKRDGGQFKNNRGEVINYDASYNLKVDEMTEQGIRERNFKIPLNSPLVSDLAKREVYSDILLDFDILIYSNRVSIVPVAILK